MEESQRNKFHSISTAPLSHGDLSAVTILAAVFTHQFHAHLLRVLQILLVELPPERRVDLRHHRRRVLHHATLMIGSAQYRQLQVFYKQFHKLAHLSVAPPRE